MKQNISPAAAGIAIAVAVVILGIVAFRVFAGGGGGGGASAADKARYEQMRKQFYDKPGGAPTGGAAPQPGSPGR